LNPKFYVHSINDWKIYVGPEFTGGYLKAVFHDYSVDSKGQAAPISSAVYRYATFTTLMKAGFELLEPDRVSFPEVIFEIGLGLGGIYGPKYAYGLTGVWQVGIKMGFSVK
jgi:hypothetical protein